MPITFLFHSGKYQPEDQDIFSYWVIGSRWYSTLKSLFLLVNFILFKPIFRLSEIIFLCISYMRSILHKLLYFFLPIQQPIVLARLKKSAHVLSSSQSGVYQVNNNWLTSTIDESFNRCQTKYQFTNNHWNINAHFNISM